MIRRHTCNIASDTNTASRPFAEAAGEVGKTV